MENVIMSLEELGSSPQQDMSPLPSREFSGIERSRHGRGNTSISTAATLVMDDTLWAALPEEVMITILSCLPLVSLLRFSCVCKKWNILVRSEHFRRVRAKVCGKQLHHEYIRLMELSSAFAGSQVKASVGGLLLLTFDERSDVYVINPSQVSQRQIPELPNLRSGLFIGCGMLRNKNIRTKSCIGSRYYTVGLVVVPESKAFYVLAVSKSCEVPLGVQLYDSSQDSWRSAGSLMPEPGQINFHIVSVIMHGGCLHCMSVSFNEDFSANFRVLRFDKPKKQWDDLAGAVPSVRYSCRSFPLLFEHRGRLLLAGASKLVFHIWEYDHENLEWKPIESLPDVIMSLVSSKTSCGLYSQACGDFLCVGAYPTRKFLASSPRRRSETVLIYNLLDRSWRLLQSPQVESRFISWLNRRFLYDSRQLHHSVECRTPYLTNLG